MGTDLEAQAAESLGISEETVSVQSMTVHYSASSVQESRANRRLLDEAHSYTFVVIDFLISDSASLEQATVEQSLNTGLAQVDNVVTVYDSSATSYESSASSSPYSPPPSPPPSFEPSDDNSSAANDQVRKIVRCLLFLTMLHF